VQLTENRRQRDAWERQALRHLRDGDIDRAIGSYRDHDRITLGDNAEDTRARLVADWWGARLAGDDVVMLAGRRSDVDDLNRRARTGLEPTGDLHGPTLLIDGTPFQAGDEVMTLRNDRRLRVRNGGKARLLPWIPQPVPSLWRFGLERPSLCPRTMSPPDSSHTPTP
jgi:ATP-dependent exoDNAse (exonuclease V) alpha subunit